MTDSDFSERSPVIPGLAGAGVCSYKTCSGGWSVVSAVSVV